MLEMRPGCEACDNDLPPDGEQAFICSFECTFCNTCSEAMSFTCKNCHGILVKRPTRTGKELERHPATTKRTFSPG